MKQPRLLSVERPDLAAELHPHRNIGIDLAKVSYGTQKKLWWLCSKCNSEFEMSANYRTNSNCGCVCKKVVKLEYSLYTTHPGLIKEWSSLNTEFTPQTITYGSTHVVWWTCLKCRSDYDSSPNHRTGGGLIGKCPYCRGMRVNETNAVAALHPELVKQWHPTKNGDLTLHKVTEFSAKVIHWLCLNEPSHEWSSAMSDKMSGEDCPFCASRRAWSGNCLAGKFPGLASEWHPTLNGSLTPEDTLPYSGKNVWWLCKKEGHAWDSPVSERTSNGSNCAFCSNKRLCETNSLAAVFPEIAAEWDYENNDGLKPTEVVYGTNKRISWICNKGHKWQQSASGRTLAGYGCRFCKTSKGNRLVGWWLNKHEIGFVAEHRFSDCRRQLPLPFDFYIPSANTCIEFDGYQHYFGWGNETERGWFLPEDSLEDIKARDLIKTTYCISNNIRLIRIPYWDIDRIDEILSKELPPKL